MNVFDYTENWLAGQPFELGQQRLQSFFAPLLRRKLERRITSRRRN